MPKIQTYDDMEVSLVRSTQSPAQLVKAACDLTQTKEFHLGNTATGPLIKFLIKAGHGSVLEHCSLTFVITGMSRSFLAQITRHRIGSFTSSSQHYADHSDMPMVLHPDWDQDGDIAEAYTEAIRFAVKSYEKLIQYGVPIYEARQVLPNACAVNLLWTVNTRSLINFMQQRLCKRNVTEAVTAATKVRLEVYKWWPELADLMGPPCYPTGKCNQGKMSCGDPYDPKLG